MTHCLLLYGATARVAKDGTTLRLHHLLRLLLLLGAAAMRLIRSSSVEPKDDEWDACVNRTANARHPAIFQIPWTNALIKSGVLLICGSVTGFIISFI